MGDLKKKKDFVVKTSEDDILIEKENLSTDEQTIERLREYIKKFYEIQIEKQNDNKGD